MRFRSTIRAGARCSSSATRSACARLISIAALALWLAGTAGAAEVLVIDESCFDDLSTCERVYAPSPPEPSPESRPGPPPVDPVPNLAPAPSASEGASTMHFSNASLDMTREQLLPDGRAVDAAPDSHRNRIELVKRGEPRAQPRRPESPSRPESSRDAQSGPIETAPREAATARPGERFTRCVESSIRAGNGLGESSRVCRSIHPE